ncbi:MAG: tyrosine-type recombinase/integrase [Streptosporangiales bacterium]|nr:tyrosine-type recombinase/integrase [Streptosporangiales bacterium]
MDSGRWMLGGCLTRMPLCDPQAGMTPSRATGLHQLRHWWVSTLIDGGATIKEVQTYAGHSSSRITLDIYGDLFERSGDRVRKIITSAFGNDAYPLRTVQDQ